MTFKVLCFGKRPFTIKALLREQCRALHCLEDASYAMGKVASLYI
jgi:hypothetical protein